MWKCFSKPKNKISKKKKKFFFGHSLKAETTLKQNIAEGLICQISRPSMKFTVTKVVWYPGKRWHKGPWNEAGKPKIDSRLHSQLIFSKVPTQGIVGKDSLDKSAREVGWLWNENES